ncbi:MAG: membrane-bound PQQ-dependent dehydrogenase, glucose/quinate/shikimate family, partial [Rhizobium oryzihabitans]
MSKPATSTSLPARVWLFVLGAVIVAAGLFFAILGSKLAALGGSLYFITAGIALIVSGLLIVLRKPVGALLFGLVVIFTGAWSIWEAGLHFWPLISRLLALGVGATVVALSYPLLRRAAGKTPAYGASFALA